MLERAGGLELDAVVVEPRGEGSAEYVERNFVGVRAIRCADRGLGHACNRALETVNARYVLFLNPRLGTCAGSLDTLVSALDSRPEVAAAGVRQHFPVLSHSARHRQHVSAYPGIIMEAMSDKWSSERLDDLNRRVENGFNRLDADLRDIRGEVGELRGEMNSRFEHVDARFEHMDARFDALQRTMLQLGGGAIAALIGLIATQL